jgi:hypothetical protein
LPAARTGWQPLANLAGFPGAAAFPYDLSPEEVARLIGMGIANQGARQRNANGSRPGACASSNPLKGHLAWPANRRRNVMAYKILVNKSGTDMSNVALQTRQGSDPSHAGPVVQVGPLKNGESKKVSYGDDQNPFLNGITIVFASSGSNAEQNQIVTTRGSAWDNTLNTNDTVTFTGASAMSAVGSNS